jgi:hypothetical protein
MAEFIYSRRFLATDIRSHIALARRRGKKVRVPRAAAQLAREYPGFSEQELRNRLFAEAVQAGVQVDLRAS